MTESSFTQNMLADQLQSRDPFVKAQAMYGQQQQDGSGLQPAQPADAPVNAIGALYGQPGQNALNTDDAGSSFTKLLTQQGIDTQGLQFNDVGRLQLQSRLQKKFGQGYNTDPNAQSILKEFEQNMKRTQPDDVTQKMQTSQAGADRTLAFLMGGQS